MVIKTSATMESVSGVIVDEIIKNMVKEKIESTDKDDIESCGESIESITSNQAFVCNEKKLYELKTSLCTPNMMDATIEWEMGDFVQTCEGDDVELRIDTIEQSDFFAKLEEMKTTLQSFLNAVLDDYREKNGTKIDRIEIIGGTSHVPMFIEAIEERIKEYKKIALPTDLKYTLNSTECLAEGGCLLDMCTKPDKTTGLSDEAFFTMSYCPPCYFRNEKKFEQVTGNYRLEFTAWDGNKWTEKKRNWKKDEEMEYAVENGVVVLNKSEEFKVKNNTSVMFFNPNAKVKFPEMYFSVENAESGPGTEVDVQLSVDQNGIPHIRGTNEKTKVQEFYVPMNGNTNLATIRRSMEEAMKEADEITVENPEGKDWSLLARMVYNTRQCDAFEAKQKEINAWKNECHVYLNDNGDNFSEGFMKQIQPVIRTLVNANKKEDVEKAKAKLGEIQGTDAQHVEKYMSICNKMEELYADLCLKRIQWGLSLGIMIRIHPEDLQE